MVNITLKPEPGCLSETDPINDSGAQNTNGLYFVTKLQTRLKKGNTVVLNYVWWTETIKTNSYQRQSEMHKDT